MYLTRKSSSIPSVPLLSRDQPYNNNSVLLASQMLHSQTSRNLREQIGDVHMRVDLYTKVILTLIALLLAVFTLKPILEPQAALADGFAGIQFSYSGGNHAFFNTSTGDVW